MEKCFSIDLRCFNNSMPDYGVENYLETLGCIPDKLFNHETYVDQLHTHTGVIDDTLLEPQWTSQRAIPGVQRWTKRQFKGLVDALHHRGIKIYQGAEAAWNYWPEYGTINRCDYTYKNLNELFLLHSNGTTSQEERGCINPLRHLRSGEWYEDLLARDVVRFLEDYNMDGFFAADGFAGLDCPLDQGDFSEDMTDQFSLYLGKEIPQLPVKERAKWILGHYRCEWAFFYSERWATFYRKLTKALYSHGKDLIIFTPWTLGPADSLMTYGVDYGKLRQAGVHTMCLEVMEEVIGRRWHHTNSWETTGLTAAITAGLQAPGMKILWTAATANIPEHWHTPRDLPNILEREALAIGSAGVINSDGVRSKAFDGFLTIFGIDLNHPEWDWFLKRTALGFGFEETSNLGLCLLWSDSVLYEHVRRTETWKIKEAVAQLHFSGVSVQCGCTIPGMEKSNEQDAFLLIDPLGISDEEVRLLESAVAAGKKLVVMGRVENQKLIRLLGLSESEGEACKEWQIVSASKLWLQGVPQTSGICKPCFPLCADTAVPMILNGNRVLAGRTQRTLYLGYCRTAMPDFSMKMGRAELNCDRPAYPREGTNAETLRECAQNFLVIHPDCLELALSRCIYEFLPQLPRIDKGQYYGLHLPDGEILVTLENAAMPVYTVSELKLPQEVLYANELSIRRLGPLGYRYWHPDKESLFVSVPPDCCIPFRVRYSLQK